MSELEVDDGDGEIDRIREVRHQISEQFGHDPYRLVAYYMELQKEHPEKLVRAPEAEPATEAPAKHRRSA
jgi:hypothetical protein